MSNTSTLKLALFDLDETLLHGDSDFEWTQFLISEGVLDRAGNEAKNAEFLAQYNAGTLDIDAFLACQLAPLTRYPRVQLDAWRQAFVATRIRPLLGAPARALVRRHRDEGAVLALVTATNSFITGPIARELGIEHLIATIPAWDGERFTGAARGTPSFRAGKVERVEAWLESLGSWWGAFDETWFYSDSHNDLPLLSRVSHPVAVDPDDTLREHAGARGWSIISLRD